MFNDMDYLLILPIVVLLFSAYEIAGLTLKGWHTISWYAQKYRWLGYSIVGLFLTGGVSGGIWFTHHLGHIIPK